MKELIPWMPVASGGKFWFDDKLFDNHLSIDDIAHSLSMQVRYNGHVKKFYSVAEHSVRVSLVVESWSLETTLSSQRIRHLVKSSLLHDAGEAVIGDIIAPVKQRYFVPDAGVESLEYKVDSLIERLFDVDFSDPVIKRADLVLRSTELRDLFSFNRLAEIDNVAFPPLKSRIEPWGQQLAKAAFLARFYELESEGILQDPYMKSGVLEAVNP